MDWLWLTDCSTSSRFSVILLQGRNWWGLCLKEIEQPLHRLERNAFTISERILSDIWNESDNCRIPYTSVDGKHAGNLKELSSINPYFYLFAKNLTGKRKAIETVNQVVLRLFSREQVNQLLSLLQWILFRSWISGQSATWVLSVVSTILLRRRRHSRMQPSGKLGKHIPFDISFSVGRLGVVFTVILPFAVISISSIFIEIGWATQIMITFRREINRYLNNRYYQNKWIGSSMFESKKQSYLLFVLGLGWEREKEV